MCIGNWGKVVWVFVCFLGVVCAKVLHESRLTFDIYKCKFIEVPPGDEL